MGFSRRSLWTSSSTYKSDWVANLPIRPSNGIAYLLIFLGACGLALALLIGNGSNATGFAILVAAVSILFLLLIGRTKYNHHRELEEMEDAAIVIRCYRS